MNITRRKSMAKKTADEKRPKVYMVTIGNAAAGSDVPNWMSNRVVARDVAEAIGKVGKLGADLYVSGVTLESTIDVL
jgi:hypothetical protein